LRLSAKLRQLHDDAALGSLAQPLLQQWQQQQQSCMCVTLAATCYHQKALQLAC
jgi:hypothetical protein